MILPDYSAYLQSWVDLVLKNGGRNPIPPNLLKPIGLPESPKILILAPHPDDECLMAGFALRAKEEWGSSIYVLPYSFGSRVERRLQRKNEMKAAIQVLGFELIDPRTDQKLERLTMSEFVSACQSIQPDVILSPHPDDHHPAHVEASQMVRDFRVAQAALFSKEGAKKNQITWIQTEYWKHHSEPNFFLPLTMNHVIQMGQALQKHEGEISRNPYHLSLPAWLIDQARRAPEVLGGFGTDSDQFLFGVLLKIQSNSAAS
jgi:LmbE family N-acetylglucosaminyl deacetylase